MSKVTTKSLYTQVVEEIAKKLSYSKSSTNTSTSSSGILSASAIANSISDVSVAELITAVQDTLYEALPAYILEGLVVTATTPISNTVSVYSGKGSVGGVVYTLSDPTTITINFDSDTEVFYIALYKDGVIVDKTYNKDHLTIAKIVVPKPGQTILVQDNKDSSWNAYIVNFTEYKLYGHNDIFEEDTIELLRNNISPILADNLIGNIRLTENLKIINTQGTLELDSKELRLLDTNETVLAKFNSKGTFFYNENGVEIAKFSTDEARIGNILVTKNSIQSADYISENQGFKITDAGFAEFENVRIRGKISSSVFEYDRVSAIGGKLYVGNASTLTTDISIGDTSITVDDPVFNTGDVLVIKDGANEEWMLVTSEASEPTYSVTRDLVTSTSGYNWTVGTAIVSTGNGQSGTQTGFIKLDAVSEYSPFIDISLRNSETYDDHTLKTRLGNLAGITDSDFGTLSGFGLYSDNVYLKGSLYSSTICSSNIYGSTITGNTIQTSTNYPKTVFDSYSIKTYDSSGIKTFEIKDGCVEGNTIKLQSPDCCCCYSYLSSGQWYFHDELGNQNPYVKRICAGEATTGGTICLSGWRGQPYIQIGIKDLAAYNPVFAVSCQKWCVFYNNLTCYCNSAVDYGWCFDVHATLYKSSGAYDEVQKDVAFDTSVYTYADACCSVVRNRFLLWCFTCASSAYYGYGIICYQIKYKCCETGCTWTCCLYTYTQPHDSTVALKTCQDVCNILCFPSAGTWEIQTNCLCLTWCLTALNPVVCTCCCRTINCCNSCYTISVNYGWGDDAQYICWSCDVATLVGSTPNNVYCSYICYCVSTAAKLSCMVDGEGRFWSKSGYVISAASCILDSHCSPDLQDCNIAQYHTYANGGCINLNPACDISYINIDNWICVYEYHFGTTTIILCSDTTLQGMYLVQCYCAFPSDCAFVYNRLWSLKDYAAEQTILDPNGILNYLAIGYN